MENDNDIDDSNEQCGDNEKIETQNSSNEKIENLQMEENVVSNKIKRKWFISTTLGITLMILIFAVVSVCVYAPIKNFIFSGYDLEQYLGNYDFAYILSDLTKHINRTEFENKDSYTDRYNNMENIKYYIKNTETNEFASNISDLGYYTLQEEINNSRFYLHAAIDEKGNPSITGIKAAKFNKTAFMDSLKTSHSPIGKKEELADLQIHFIVPEKLGSTNDVLIRNMKSVHLQQRIILIFAIGGISILLLIILAFSLPYSSQKQAGIVRLFNKMYLEFKFLCWFCFLMLDIGVLNIVSYNAPHYIDFDLTTVIYDANWYFYLVGIPVTFTLYYLIYLSICYIKHIYHTSFVEEFIKNTILGKIFFYISHNVKTLVNNIVNIDETKEYRKKLLTLLGINLLALGLIAFTFPLGWIFALGYTLLLFNYSVKVLEKVRFLNEASSLLSKGNFDIVLPVDMGILSPFSKNLNNIKEGFKVAVEKEVKSQNMKTELITNVSHDLKTPLTSIITYVDLLKAEGIDKEARKEYIDVLDKKSKRLKVLIDDLFDISKASSGNIELHLEKLDVIALLRQTLGELEEKINESGLQMRINLPESKAICELDGRKTYRVFDNILSNIFKYSMANSRVYIDVEENERNISFIFKNIAAYEMNFNSSDIMERFTRGDASRSTDGSGLGLAIAKSLVELQKGKLSITVDGDLFKLIVTFPKSK